MCLRDVDVCQEVVGKLVSKHGAGSCIVVF